MNRFVGRIKCIKGKHIGLPVRFASYDSLIGFGPMIRNDENALIRGDAVRAILCDCPFNIMQGFSKMEMGKQGN